MLLNEVLGALHHYTRDVIIVTDADMSDGQGPRIVFVNDAFTTQTGYTMQEVLGKTPRILQGKESDAAVIQRMGRDLRAWRPVREQILNYRKDGSTFWTDMSIVPVPDQSGLVHFWVSVQRDVTAKRAANDLFEKQKYLLERKNTELEVAAREDSLTGLMNRYGFWRWIEEDSRADEAPFGIMQIDVDQLKSVNDTFGYDAGDLVLKTVGERLLHLKAEKDIVVRLGGDEFLLVRPSVTKGEIKRLAPNLISQLSKPVQYGPHVCSFGVNAGGAMVDFAGLRDGSGMTASDVARFEAKASGRNVYKCYTQQMDMELQKRKAITERLSIAVANGDFTVSLMPKVREFGGEVVGYEALVRWEHPALGNIMPADFLPQANALKLTSEIDKIVLHKSIDIQQRISKLCGHNVPVSVNVSPDRLFSAGIMQELIGLNIAPGAIVFELLETFFFDEPSTNALTIIQDLRNLGIGIDIDDFGTGYASLIGLMSIRPDTLKIDRFIAGPVHESTKHFKLVEAIISIAKSLEIPVLAEGVETQEQAQLLSAMGVAFLQGYLIGKPKDAELLIREMTG